MNERLSEIRVALAVAGISDEERGALIRERLDIQHSAQMRLNAESAMAKKAAAIRRQDRQTARAKRAVARSAIASVIDSESRRRAAPWEGEETGRNRKRDRH